jgi:hypothetical protein
MRWAKKFFISNDPNYGTLLSLVDDNTAGGLAYWISMPQTRAEFVNQVNGAITGSGYSFVQMMGGLRLQIWDEAQDFNNCPDFCGWGQFQRESLARKQHNIDLVRRLRDRIRRLEQFISGGDLGGVPTRT